MSDAKILLTEVIDVLTDSTVNLGKANLAAIKAAATLLAADSNTLSYDLDGVIFDVEEGNGFDSICLETLTRVRNSLGKT